VFGKLLKHHHVVLQVDDDVSQDDIKTAYRQLAKYCHPDVNDDGHDLCILLNEVRFFGIASFPGLLAKPLACQCMLTGQHHLTTMLLHRHTPP